MINPLAEPTRLATKIFKSGNSLSVRIPASMVPQDVPSEAEIEVSGGAWIIRPIAAHKLTGLAAKLRAFSPSFMAQGRAPQTQREHEWVDDGGAAQATPKFTRPRGG